MSDSASALFIRFLLLIGLLALIGIVRFCVADAKLRGKSPLLVSLAALFFFPWGLFAWLVFRPEAIYRKQFRLEDHQVQ